MTEARDRTPEISDPSIAEDDGRPEDCECGPCLSDLPCWTCYREGFDDPNPAVDNGE